MKIISYLQPLVNKVFKLPIKLVDICEGGGKER